MAMITTDAELKSTINQIKNGELKNRQGVGDGLSIFINDAGDAEFRFRYTSPTGKRVTMALGTYGAEDGGTISLADARAKALGYKAQIRQGKDPQVETTEEKSQAEESAKEDTFDYYAQLYFAANAPELDKNGEHKIGKNGKPIGWGQDHYKTQTGRYINYIQPAFGNRNVADITPLDIHNFYMLFCKEDLWQTLEKLNPIICGAFDRATLAYKIYASPAAGQLKMLAQQHKHKGEMSYIDIADKEQLPAFEEMIQAIFENTAGTFSTKYALKLAPHLFIRTGNLAGLRWEWVDFERKQIVIPKMKTKSKRSPYAPDLLVPLSPQAEALLRDIQPLSGRGAFVFPGSRRGKNGHITVEALEGAFNRLGYGEGVHQLHSFRKSAKTWMKEQGFSEEATELQLHHTRPALEATYDKSTLLPERTKMMQAWSGFLNDCLKS